MARPEQRAGPPQVLGQHGCCHLAGLSPEPGGPAAALPSSPECFCVDSELFFLCSVPHCHMAPPIEGLGALDSAVQGRGGIGVVFFIFLNAFCNEIISVLVLSEARLEPPESWVQVGSGMGWKSRHQPEPRSSALDIGDQAWRRGVRGWGGRGE